MITVEDYNSFLQKYGIKNSYHRIDTSLVGLDDFEDMMIDFCTVTKETSGGTSSFIFTINNDAWTGGYYLTTVDGTYIDDDATIEDSNILSYDYSDDVVLVLHCCNLKHPNSDVIRLNEILVTDNVSYNNTMPSSYTFKDLSDSSTSTKSPISTSGDIGYFSDNIHCCINFRPLNRLTFDLSSVELYGGQVNQIVKPSDNGLITLTYLDKKETFDLSEINYLTIDLTGQYNLTSVKVQVHVHATSNYYESIETYNVPIVPITVNSFNDFLTATTNNSNVINYNTDDDFTQYVTITKDTMIRAYSDTDVALNMNNYGFIVDEGVTLKLQGLTINEGNPAILQKNDSKVELNNCTFNNCTNEDNADLGSVICCSLDTDSLNYTDDYTTNIIGCNFNNNQNCILHGGTLSVIGSNYKNNDMSYASPNNPAFLFQVDGEAVITDSSFDIDYGEQSTFEEQPIMYAQALFVIGETAHINNAGYSDLNEDNKVNWHNNPYNNRSHLYCKYYYPSINQVVYSSPKPNYESKSMCYALSGVDWVFKENVQITIAEDEEE